jgi:hypothetical protein
MFPSILLLGLLLQPQAEPMPAPPYISLSLGGMKAKVRNHTGAPVSGVRILLKASAGRAWVTFSDEKGQFQAGSLPPGEYTLELAKGTYPSPVYPGIRIKADAWLRGVPSGPPELRRASGPRLHVVGAPTYEFLAGVITPYTRPEIEKIPTH